MVGALNGPTIQKPDRFSDKNASTIQKTDKIIQFLNGWVILGSHFTINHSKPDTNFTRFITIPVFEISLYLDLALSPITGNMYVVEYFLGL
jgi:hypothetical protein